MADPCSHAMYQMMVRQLMHDGYTHAAEVVGRSSLTAVVDTHTGADRLLRAVRSQEDGARAAAAEQEERAQQERWKHAYAYFGTSAQLTERYQAMHSAQVRCLRFSQDGQYLASGSANGRVQLYSVAAMLAGTRGSRGPSEAAIARVFDEHGPDEGRRMSVNDLHFHASEPGFLLTGCRDGLVRMFNYTRPQHSKCVGTLRDEYQVRSMSPHPNGANLLTGTDHPVPRLWDIAQQRAFAPSEQARSIGVSGSPAGAINSCAFSPDGRTFATGTVEGRICVWDPLSSQSQWLVVPINNAHCGAEVTSVTYSHDGRVLVSGGRDGCCRLFDVRTFKCLACFGRKPSRQGPVGHRVLASLTAHGECIAGVLSDGDCVTLYDRTTKDELKLEHNRNVSVRALATSPDSPFIATGDDGHRVRFWAPAPETDQEQAAAQP
eukprot:TRINITY_DN1881_c4_g1_i1.p1 TRINITY_DN1881_c4_g1~~TRINITY_DN1881_c4_g1_i1.p1  ORF type:complete len:434 (+),score=44.26 TRINITY_DN1881_c4_g1_i1:76-1377(+)